jgi:hypothetical protein
MGIIQILTGLLRGKPGRDGVWDFFGKRSAHKGRVELEKVRNEGTQKLVSSLPPGAVLIEGGRGWFREIHMPETFPPWTPLSTVAARPRVPPLPADELETSSRNELAPPLQQRSGSTDDPC